MPQARILINAVPGSDDDVQINVLVQLDNQSLGDETSYTWAILDQPPGTTDTLSATTIKNPSFTPRKEGTYLLKLTVDLGLPTEQSDTQLVAVRQMKTRERIPASGESTQDDAADGWAASMNSLLRRIDALLSDPGILVGAAGAAGLARGSVLRVASGTVIKSGLPGQETVPTFTLALGSSLPQTDELLCVMEGDVSTGGTPASGALCKARYIGRCANVFVNGGAGGAAGDTVYLSDAGIPSLTEGSYRRQLGSVMANLGAGYYDLWFDGVGGYDITPIDRGYVLYGAPASGMINSRRIDGANATGNTVSGRPYTFRSGFITDPSLVARAMVGQTAAIFEVQASSGAPLAFFDNLFGSLNFSNAARHVLWPNQDIGQNFGDATRFNIGAVGVNLNAFQFVTTSSTFAKLEVWGDSAGTVKTALQSDAVGNSGLVGTLTAHNFYFAANGAAGWFLDAANCNLNAISNRKIIFGTGWALRESPATNTPLQFSRVSDGRVAAALTTVLATGQTVFGLGSTDSAPGSAEGYIEASPFGTPYLGIMSGGHSLLLGADGTYLMEIKTSGEIDAMASPLMNVADPRVPEGSYGLDVPPISFLGSNRPKRERWVAGISRPWASPSPRYPSDSPFFSTANAVYPAGFGVMTMATGSAASTNWSLGGYFFLPDVGRFLFSYRCLCNTGDRFRVYIDGVLVVETSGNTPGRGGLFVSAPLQAGVHYVDFRFLRDANAAYGGNVCAITDLSALTEGELGAMGRGMSVFDEPWTENQNATTLSWPFWLQANTGGGWDTATSCGIRVRSTGPSAGSYYHFAGPHAVPPIQGLSNFGIFETTAHVDISGHGAGGAYQVGLGFNPESSGGLTAVCVEFDETIVSKQTYLHYGDWPGGTTYQIPWTDYDTAFHRYTIGINPAGSHLNIDGKALYANMSLSYDTATPLNANRGHPFFWVRTVAAGTTNPLLQVRRLTVWAGADTLTP